MRIDLTLRMILTMRKKLTLMMMTLTLMMMTLTLMMMTLTFMMMTLTLMMMTLTLMMTLLLMQAMQGENCTPGTELDLGEEVVDSYGQVSRRTMP